MGYYPSIKMGNLTLEFMITYPLQNGSHPSENLVYVSLNITYQDTTTSQAFQKYLSLNVLEFKCDQ